MSQPLPPERPAAGGENRQSSTRATLIASARGFVAVSGVSLLLVVGLWALAREAPSAGTSMAPMLAPTTITVRNRFRIADFPTARAIIPGSPEARPIGAGIPRRTVPDVTREAPSSIGQPGRAPDPGGVGAGGRAPDPGGLGEGGRDSNPSGFGASGRAPDPGGVGEGGRVPPRTLPVVAPSRNER